MDTHYSVPERVVDGVIHAIAIAASIAAVSVLLTLSLPSLSIGTNVAIAVYGLTLIAMFSFSAAYNHLPVPHLKPLLRRFDQAAIYLKIAGAYTPFTVLIGDVYSYIILGFVWVAALSGAAAKIGNWPLFERFEVVVYLVLGWLSVLLIWPLVMAAPLAAVILIFAGGCLYSIGVIFHLWESLKFQNAIWHGFVLAAASCHYVAVAQASFAV